MKFSKMGLFLCGALTSTIGYRMLRSPEARKVYTYLTATVLREKDHIMKEVTEIREECGDVYADAVAHNEALAGAQTVIEDCAAEA